MIHHATFAGSLLQFRERTAKTLDHRRHKLVQRTPDLSIEHLAAVPHCAAEDAAQHIPAAHVAREGTIGDREGQRPDVIGDDAVRRVDVVLVVLAEPAACRAALKAR
jgi:hypothetical protein